MSKKELMKVEHSMDLTTAEAKELLKNTVAQGATDAELGMFIAHCQATGLDPILKEVWFIKTKGYTKRDGTAVEGRVQIMTGLQGFLKVANRHPAYDGMECEVIRENGKPVAAIAKVYRKDRKFPSVGEALWSEYYKPNPNGRAGIWEQMPSIMLAKCAKSLALREAFPQELNGLYTQEEMPSEYAQQQAEADKKEPQQVVVIPKPAAPAKKVQTEWLYDSMLEQDEEKRIAVEEYLDHSKCRFDSARGVFISDLPIKKCAKYLVTPEQLAARDAADELPEVKFESAEQGEA